MSKIKKSELLDIAREQGSAITNLLQRVTLLEKPQLKQLDQSVFDGLDEKWRFAAVGKNGSVYKFRFTPKVSGDSYLCDEGYHKYSLVGEGYDTSNWQNSLIEREKKELTGSGLCRAMLERGDKYVMCFVSNCGLYNTHQEDEPSVVIHHCEDGFYIRDSYYKYATPIDNQGEPLTAAEVGL